LPNEASFNFWHMQKPKKTAPKLRVWTSIAARVARRRRRWFQIRSIEIETAALALVGWIAFAAIVNAQPEPGRLPESDSESANQERGTQAICQMIEGAAAAYDLPFEFFARVIWQESRFRSDAKGPVTRGGQQAQGIAQFMPGTAAERFLHNSFDPAQALPKSAEFLRELQMQFGNLGLAAAAYNAGPSRVRDWLAGRRALPSETRAYVRIVTGRRAEEWRLQGTAVDVAIPADMPCGTIAARATPLNKKRPSKSTSPWGVQLIGDLSESKALAAYRALQKRREAILGNYQPMIIRTATAKMSAAPVWTRIRVEAGSRQDAETLCAQLRAAGEICLVQRN
jgi:transglycosylase-like protein with SLT domain